MSLLFGAILCATSLLFYFGPDYITPDAPLPPLDQQIGQLLMVGFDGSTPMDPQVQQLYRYISDGKVGGVLFLYNNTQSPTQIQALTQYLHSAPGPLPVLLALDQEGGQVYRLGSTNGFEHFPSPYYVAQNHTLTEAFDIYLRMANVISDHGFNMNLGTILDLNMDHESPIVGQIDRSYDSDPQVVADYAEKMINAHRVIRVIPTVKHFPGYGSAVHDPHHMITDVSESWDPIEIAPYRILLKKRRIDVVMSAHIMNRTVDEMYPATLSKKHLDVLRQELKYDGVIITDDLMMGAITTQYTFEDVVIRAISSGNDILIFSKLITNEGDVVARFHTLINTALADGRLTEHHVNDAYRRIHRLKKKLDQ